MNNPHPILVSVKRRQPVPYYEPDHKAYVDNGMLRTIENGLFVMVTAKGCKATGYPTK